MTETFKTAHKRMTGILHDQSSEELQTALVAAGELRRAIQAELKSRGIKPEEDLEDAMRAIADELRATQVLGLPVGERVDPQTLTDAELDNAILRLQTAQRVGVPQLLKTEKGREAIALLADAIAEIDEESEPKAAPKVRELRDQSEA